MVFSTISFLFYFLPIFLLCYWVLPWRNAVLLIASLVFYTWGEPKNLPLLLICITANYFFGRAIGKAQERGSSGKLSFVLALCFNLACLAYYKYFNFAIGNLTQIAHHFDFIIPPSQQVSLPLGISFFIFHAISYLVDVYRKKTPYEKSYSALFTYIVMFPQLVAGPIVRFSAVARRLHHRRFSWARTELGMRFFILGLAQKILIANTVAGLADKVFALPLNSLSSATAWLGAVAYSLQIYFDFAGYSLMAIGLGLACGFAFPRNFMLPYSAQSITEFWRRWHMSLSRWFRDYVYIPLGGNRGSALNTARNLFIVFLLCGLWHGANWTFVVWGLLHGAFLVLERSAWSRYLQDTFRPLRHLYTLLVVLLAWVIFRSDSLAQAGAYLRVMAGGAQADAPLPLMSLLSASVMLAMLVGIFLSTSLLQHWKKGWMQERFSPVWSASLSKASTLVLLLLCAISLASGAYNPFIYFRF